MDYTFGDRIALLAKEVGGYDALAERTGLSAAVLHKYRAGKSDPSRERVLAICAGANVGLLWLATGQGPMRPGDTPTDDTEFLSAPRYDAEASCGSGAFVDEAPVLDRIPFTKEFVHKKLGRSDTSGLILLDARGDSMEPTIHDGGLIMVDTTKTSLTSAIYAFSYDGALFVKRLNHLPDAVEAVSDNKDYSPFTVSKEQMENFRIIGRVVWVGHMI